MRIDGVFARRYALNLKLSLAIRPLFTRPPSAYYASVLRHRAVKNQSPLGRFSSLGIHNTPADLVRLFCHDAGNIHIGGFVSFSDPNRDGLRLIAHTWMEYSGER